MFSNLRSFHLGKLLQNSTALPAHIYRQLNNKQLLRKSVGIPKHDSDAGVAAADTKAKAMAGEHIPAPRISGTEKQTSKHRRLQQKVPETTKPFEAVNASADCDERVWVVAEANVKDKTIAEEHMSASRRFDTEKQTGKRGRFRRETPETAKPSEAVKTKHNGRVWKPGRGVVEKVDKLTGEIVHLVDSE